MATVTAALVKELRERTGAGMMDCKKALVEANADIELAIENMRKSGAAKEIKESQVALEKSRSELSKLKTDDFTKAKDLFKAVKGLHNAYYLSLIEQLSVTAKILDADGD